MATTINVENITSGVVGGTGSFDKMATSMTSHLEKEYDAGRITGADYANAYISGLNAAMAQSVAFELQRTIAEANTDVIIARGGFR